MNEIQEISMEQVQAPEVERNNMGRFARLAAVAAITVGSVLAQTDMASSHEQEAPAEEGGALIPPAYACPDPITARWIACWHTLHGHEQWRNGQGTPGHTWSEYRREARLLRRYLENVS